MINQLVTQSRPYTFNDLNELIKSKGDDFDKGKISDGYHTFGELYEHRIALYVCLCQLVQAAAQMMDIENKVWRSKAHSDGSVWDGWFILGIGTEAGKQITYHLPMSEWDNTNFAATLLKAPEYDGHTSNDVLQRIKTL